MKKNLLFVVFLLSISTAEMFALATTGSWRFRNDDGDQATATWKAEQDDSVFQKNESNIRLRFQFMEGTGNGFHDSVALYYKSVYNDMDTVWHLVTNDPSEAFQFSLSTSLDHHANLSKQLSTTSTATYLTGAAFTKPGFVSLSMGNSTYTEFEYCIKPSANADFNKTYVFSINCADTSTVFYGFDIEALPKLTLQKPKLTVTAGNATRHAGAGNPAFAVTYSGFVDGDNEAVLNTLPKKICGASAESPQGSYDIVPYGAADNKYDFVYVSGKLTVTAASGIDENYSETLTIYPNPTSGTIYLKGLIPANSTARIYDLTGRMVLEQILDGQEIDISSISNGAYLLYINGVAHKIIKR